MRYLAAEVIYPISSAPLHDHVLAVTDDGRIVAILPATEVDHTLVEHFKGALCPGFINTHCHLELSHLMGKFPMKTGLPAFLMEVTKQRSSTEEEMLHAMQTADRYMWESGIVAVGDISNMPHSFQIKSESNIYYHTFIELLALDPARSGSAMQQGISLVDQARGFNLKASLAPHAPYTVSMDLVHAISEYCRQNGEPTSIHMLESNDENEFFVQATGLYRKLYRELGVSISHFEPTGKTSLASILPGIDRHVTTLLVHNTIATSWDATWAEEFHPHLYWCFCPNANLFIEDRLPDIPELMQHVQYITIGTDSLASNHQLSVLEELKTISGAFPQISTNDLLRWSTLNGARFLGIHDRFGSLTVGLKPGILHLSDAEIGVGTAVTRLF